MEDFLEEEPFPQASLRHRRGGENEKREREKRDAEREEREE